MRTNPSDQTRAIARLAAVTDRYYDELGEALDRLEEDQAVEVDELGWERHVRSALAVAR